jgi:hypothetical protein
MIASIHRFGDAREHLGRVCKFGGIDEVAKPGTTGDSVGLEKRSFHPEELAIQGVNPATIG